MNESTHVMLRLLSEDAGLGASLEAQYDRMRNERTTIKRLARRLASAAAAIIALLK